MEKPILFNTEMVKAILEGKKTVTRRVIKPQPIQQIPLGFVTSSTDKKHEDCFGWGMSEHGGIVDYAKLPCKIGDILYVRETWCDTTKDLKDDSDLEVNECRYIFKVDDNGHRQPIIEVDVKRWRPSIHMPKEATRIFLEVTNVRVERLQDITEDQAIKEGCSGIECKKPHNYNSDECCGYCNNSGYIEPPELEFLYLWNSTLKKEQLKYYGWDNNPWVWVIEFKKLESKEV
ncbi:hypothetical protein [Clostridium sp. UBA871]|uniref:hypothetical protein n=1 Tax=Clostridium sp. UBA871 TaxID=1946380 RepID=UPI003216C222